SAQTMKAAVAYLEPFMDKDESDDSGKGTVVIATVKGDVHDIGKNLVDIILSNNGYKVANIGIKQPVDNIIAAFKEHNADCIAMSGLLVKSTAFMKENLKTFNEHGIDVPVILGGAALTPKFVNEDCQNTYKGQVIYGKDAFADLHFMDALMPAKKENKWDNLKGFAEDHPMNQQVKAAKLAAKKLSDDAEKAEKSDEPKVIDTRRSDDVAIDIERPAPPFWGPKMLGPEDIPLEDLFDYLDMQALVAGQWQFRKPKGQSREEYDEFLAEKVQPILKEWKQRVVDEKLLEPKLMYGYFPCLAEGNTLYVYDWRAAQKGEPSEPVTSFEFPRQGSMRRLCIADFFLPKAQAKPGEYDVFPMQAVTMGDIATEFAASLFKADDYTNYLYYHGLAVQMAEALAEWSHQKIRFELGYADQEPAGIRNILAQRYQGSRYSFGYPACPNMQDQPKQLDLLEVEKIGMHMDESEQLYPEQSTTAIVAYHGAAKYFSA
ncbi:MAG: vitamin B12 dependent-methionine synthase activation domain-containing protein, partial [Cyanobacteria bacterium J06588_5]